MVVLISSKYNHVVAYVILLFIFTATSDISFFICSSLHAISPAFVKAKSHAHVAKRPLKRYSHGAWK
jgi:hypothetical protein